MSLRLTTLFGTLLLFVPSAAWSQCQSDAERASGYVCVWAACASIACAPGEEGRGPRKGSLCCVRE